MKCVSERAYRLERILSLSRVEFSWFGGRAHSSTSAPTPVILMVNNINAVHSFDVKERRPNMCVCELMQWGKWAQVKSFRRVRHC